jgi:endo-1,3-1,4-beta-glycanase ExoK
MRLEIDIEFIGKDTKVFQSNFFHTMDNRYANSASGNEKLHKLGFDASKDFHAYTFVWSEDSIKWYADGRLVRTAKASESYIPNPKQSTMRIAANVWPVNKQAEEWAGPKPADLSYAQAEYKWIQFSETGQCQMTC